jgi:hypothetical protein
MKQFDVKNWRNKFIFESKFDLPGDQEKIDVAEPKGEITKADFDKLRKDKETNEGEDNDSGGGTLKIEKQGDKYYWTWNPKSGKSQKSYDGFESKADAQRDFMRKSKYMKESEGEDHEVSMANNSLEAIVKAAMELKAKMGDKEKDIPAWIQDHITNAANFIRQASENYHEYGGEEQDIEGEDNSSMMESDGYTIEDFLSVLKNYPNISSKEQVVTAYNKLDAADQPEALKKASGKDVLPMPAKERPKRF